MRGNVAKGTVIIRHQHPEARQNSGLEKVDFQGAAKYPAPFAFAVHARGVEDSCSQRGARRLW
jgi:hypothetical protein